MQALFPVEKTILAIKKVENPQVILWFTNYFGKFSGKTITWWKDNLFSKVKNATFWLTDLNAWTYLSLTKDKFLGGRYKDLAEKIEAKKELPLSAKKCPMTTYSSKTLDKDINNIPGYKFLSSKGFFEWLLLQKKDTTILSDEIRNKLCSDKERTGTLRFSLSDMGYKPELLNRTIVKEKIGDDGQTKTEVFPLLDIDFSKTYPILQYLEGIYYASTIIKEYAKNSANKECSIIFMLPNKEFTYSIVPGEKEYFSNFCQGIKSALSKDKIPVKTTIRFEPFWYGSNFYDAPYNLGGDDKTKGYLLNSLKEQKKILTEREKRKQEQEYRDKIVKRLFAQDNDPSVEKLLALKRQ